MEDSRSIKKIMATIRNVRLMQAKWHRYSHPESLDMHVYPSRERHSLSR
jgi:hypothetical protein